MTNKNRFSTRRFPLAPIAAATMLVFGVVHADQAPAPVKGEAVQPARPHGPPPKACKFRTDELAEIDLSANAFDTCYKLHNDPNLPIRGFRDAQYLSTGCPIKLGWAINNDRLCKRVPDNYQLSEDDLIRIDEWKEDGRELIWKKHLPPHTTISVPLDHEIKYQNVVVAWSGKAMTAEAHPTSLVYYVYLVDAPTDVQNRKSKKYQIEVFVDGDDACPKPEPALPTPCADVLKLPNGEKQGSSGGGGEPPPK